MSVLAVRLDAIQANDPDFAAQLIAEWAKLPAEARVVNHISGPVTGKALQVGEIHGNVSF